MNHKETSRRRCGLLGLSSAHSLETFISPPYLRRNSYLSFTTQNSLPPGTLSDTLRIKRLVHCAPAAPRLFCVPSTIFCPLEYVYTSISQYRQRSGKAFYSPPFPQHSSRPRPGTRFAPVKVCCLNTAHLWAVLELSGKRVSPRARRLRGREI